MSDGHHGGHHGADPGVPADLTAATRGRGRRSDPFGSIGWVVVVVAFALVVALAILLG